MREEMNRAGAIELLMPRRAAGRAVAGNRALGEVRPGAAAPQGPARARLHRPADAPRRSITDIARKELKSYKQLPVNLYHIQTKFRDEVRPRFGVMRSREFVMKDAYSFDVDKAGMLKSYQAMYDAYARIFARMGLEFRAVAADTGPDRRQRVARVPGARRIRRGRDRVVPRIRLRGEHRARRSGRAGAVAPRAGGTDAEGAHAGQGDLRGRRGAARAAARAHGQVHHARDRHRGPAGARLHAADPRRPRAERGQGHQDSGPREVPLGDARPKSSRRPAATPATSARSAFRRT